MTDIVGKILIGIVFVIMKDVNHFAKSMKKMKIDKYNDFCDRRCQYFRDEFPEEVKDVEYWKTLDKILEKS